MVRVALVDGAGLLGFVAFLWGLSRVYLPLAPIVGGAAVVAWAILAHRNLA